MRTDKNGMPFRESFAFGFRDCAFCGEPAETLSSSVALRRPIYADRAETEILIPAGWQRFHRSCWEAIRAPDGETSRVGA